MNTSNNDVVDAITRILDDDISGDANNIHIWEKPLEKTWDTIQEDASGNIIEIPDFVQDLREKLKVDRHVQESRGNHNGIVQKGLIRSLCICLDLSACASERDFTPSRAEVMKDSLIQFINSYYDQNPVCSISLVILVNGSISVFTPLGGSSVTHISKLQERIDPGGFFTLEVLIHTCVNVLFTSSPQSSREILIVTPSLSTNDTNDIEESINLCISQRIRVNFVGLNARVYLFDKFAKLTHGVYHVAVHATELRDMIMSFVTPPPVLPNTNISKTFTTVGFPQLHVYNKLHLCACHLTPISQGYECTECGAMSCQIPCNCCVCGLMLVSSPHLARSYHHLFSPNVAITISSERYRLYTQLFSPSNTTTTTTTSNASTPTTTTTTMEPEEVKQAIIAKNFTPYLKQTGVCTQYSQCARVICGGCDKPLVLLSEAALQWSLRVLAREDEIEHAKLKANAVIPSPPKYKLERDVEWWLQTQCASMCMSCGCVLCTECDATVHMSLHNCPGCLSFSKK